MKGHSAVSLIHHCIAGVGVALLPNLLHLQVEGKTLHTSVIPTVAFRLMLPTKHFYKQFLMLSPGILGAFNWSSQQGLVDWILDIHLRPRLVSSSRVFFATWYSANWPWRGFGGSFIGTGRNPWKSIALDGHSRSRS